MQDGWVDTPHVKSASKKTPTKGCPENGGGAHYYVVEKVITITEKGEEDVFRKYPRCLLCNHAGGKGVSRKRNSLEVVETKVYLKERPVMTYLGLAKGKPLCYPGDTDSRGRLLPGA